jgi:hypothetical protein
MPIIPATKAPVKKEVRPITEEIVTARAFHSSPFYLIPKFLSACNGKPRPRPIHKNLLSLATIAPSRLGAFQRLR